MSITASSIAIMAGCGASDAKRAIEFVPAIFVP